MWVIAGPAATRVLADYGATVVRVETTQAHRHCRTLAPFHELPPGPESAVLFHNMNAGKLDGDPRSHQPGGSERHPRSGAVGGRGDRGVLAGHDAGAWGSTTPSLRAVKPDLIMLSTCLMGQTGPLASFAGFGNLAAAISGFCNLCGWPDRAPAGPFGAYTDYVAPRFTAAAILAALDHRRRTGEGQYIDVSQAEASMHFLGAGAARLHRERPRPDADRQRRSRRGAARRLSGGRRRPLGRDRGRRRRAVRARSAPCSDARSWRATSASPPRPARRAQQRRARRDRRRLDRAAATPARARSAAAGARRAGERRRDQPRSLRRPAAPASRARRRSSSIRPTGRRRSRARASGSRARRPRSRARPRRSAATISTCSRPSSATARTASPSS